MKKIIIVLASLMFFFTTTNLSAQLAVTKPMSNSSEFKHAINVCPIAVVFGIYAINYEYLFAPQHGLDVRYEYEAVPKSYTDAAIESSGMAFSLNYRWHWSGEMNSVFLGAYTRYKFYNGSGVLESADFDFDLKEYTIGLNLGKRWVWDSGINATFALGYGFSTDTRTSSPKNASVDAKINEFEDSYDFISPFYGELSVGYAF